MSNNRGGKRQATSPMGTSFKDPRYNQRGQSNRFDALGDYESDGGGSWTEVPGRGNQPRTNNEHSGPTEQTNPQTDRPTFASMAAQGSQRTRSSQDARSTEQQQPKKVLDRIFKTAPPDGPMRDNIIIEIRQVNGVPFKGSLHYKEAKYGIFEKCLKQDPTIIHGLSFAFNDYPVIKYKLKHQIDIDAWKPMEYFEFERTYKVNGMEKTDVLECKIKGIRSNYNDLSEETDSDPDIRWVKIEWCDYGIEEHELLAWLEQFGEVIGHITEEIYPDSDSDGDPTGNGTFTVKMKLHSPIPQLLPMWGKRIRIYYRGIQKLCPRCFGNHPRKNCRSEKRRWIDYVLEFMEHYTTIPESLYGRWLGVINEQFGEIIQNGESNTETQNSVSETQIEPRAETRSDITQEQPEPSRTQDDPPRRFELKPAFVSRARPAPRRTQDSSNPGAQWQRSSKPTNSNQGQKLTREEEDNLAEYLNLGMSIEEARDTFKKEIEMAELRARIRENQRNRSRGEIGSSNRTQVGNSSSNRGIGRGGLSFN